MTQADRNKFEDWKRTLIDAGYTEAQAEQVALSAVIESDYDRRAAVTATVTPSATTKGATDAV